MSSQVFSGRVGDATDQTRSGIYPSSRNATVLTAFARSCTLLAIRASGIAGVCTALHFRLTICDSGLAAFS